MRIPIRVQGHDASGKAWEEMTRSLDVSQSGVAFVIRRPVQVGQVLHLALPLPPRLRAYDRSAASYKTHALVASTAKVGAGTRVGAALLGKEAPPPGAGVVGERRRGPRGRLLLKVHLGFDLDDGKVRRETTVLEDFSGSGAKVQSKFDAKVGQTLEIDESEGAFCARAEVRGSYVGTDGVRRLHLRFLPPPRAKLAR
jgi:hypothetical protein